MLVFMPFISGLILMPCKTSGISLVHQDVLKMKMSRPIIPLADFYRPSEYVARLKSVCISYRFLMSSLIS